MPAAKYFRLGRYLAALPPEMATITLTFAEIAAILGDPLPVSARTSAWWSNARRSNARARSWLDVGWRVQRANRRLADPSVTFVRVVTA